MEQTGTTVQKKSWLSIFTLELLFTLLLLIALIIFVYAARMVFIVQGSRFDENVFKAVAPYTSPGVSSFMRFITFLGKHTLLIPLNLLLLGYFIYKKHRWFAIRIAALSLSSVVLSFSLKAYFQRERPEVQLIGDISGYSFPSGHALISVVFYGLFIHIAWHEVKQKWLRTLLIISLIILIFLISFSRIYLRVHYASDVIAGLSVGFIWVVLSLRAIHRIEKRYIARKARKAEHLDD
jgi:membrane-associated phospholipid phosphatase